MIYRLNVGINKNIEINMNVKKKVSDKFLKNMDNISKDIKRDKENREAWRKAFVPNYFDSVWGRDFLVKSSLNKENAANIVKPAADTKKKESKLNRKFIILTLKVNFSKKYFLKGEKFEPKVQLNTKKQLPPITSSNFDHLSSSNRGKCFSNFLTYKLSVNI